MTEVAVWWLSRADFEAIGDTLPTWLPEWVQREYTSANGRNGRGRLWVADECGWRGSVPFPEPPTPIQSYAEQCAGIVIPVAVVSRLAHLPGLVTDTDLVRFGC